MVRRLLASGHGCVVYDPRAVVVNGLAAEGAHGTHSLAELVDALRPPRAVCLMVPAAAVDALVDELVLLLEPDDTLIDGGNSHYQDDIQRARRLHERRMHYLDMGTSGGIRGRERGYCLMIGGDPAAVQRLDSLFAALAPGSAGVSRTAGRSGALSSAERGYLYCGASGAGHFVKMVHNGIEYGLMAAYAEGLSILKNANIGKRTSPSDAESTPLDNPEHYQYDFDLGAIAELWRRGSVISSWLLDLTAEALCADPELQDFGGQVSDSGEGRWTLAAAIDEGVPAHVLGAALLERFASRDLDRFQNKVLSAMRFGFGGHREQR
jgi:6-phosphogluconate dehydrogenase